MSREKLPEQLRKQSPTSRASGAPTVRMSATEVCEGRRSEGMCHSLIGKPCLRVGLVMGLLIGLSVLSLAACGGGNSAKGGAGGEHNKSTSGGTAPTDGLIVFVRYLDQDQTKGAIFTMYPSGTHIRQITHPPEGFSDGSPAWSPDGTKVAFYRQAIDDRRPCPQCRRTSRIMVLNTETGDERQVVGVEGFDPAFSPDGHSLAFRRPAGIWIVGLDGSGLHQETNEHPNRPLAFSDFGPAFSPDGKLLVFERTRLEDDHTAVFVQRLDSSASPEDARQMTPWEMGCGYGPEFSPKGDWVLFSCRRERTLSGGSSNLYMVHPGECLEPLRGPAPCPFNGTGLDQLMSSPDDVHYVGSSFSPCCGGVGTNIVAARQP